MPWMWIGFVLLVLLLITLDLAVFHRKAHAVGVKEALLMSGVWIGLALLFNGFLYFAYEHRWLGLAPGGDIADGGEAAALFFTGYVLEKSLSVDNLFVIALIFSYFRVPPEQQHRVLYWGILGALAMRAGMILAGALLIRRFHWTLYVFGVFLIFTAIRMLRAGHESDLQNNRLVRLARRWLPVTDEYHGQHFTVRVAGQRKFTPLALALLLVEASDLVFAVDSIPAIFAITDDPFIVFTSNVFAILGLRSLYFALAGMLAKFHYLKLSLAVLMALVGVKMLLKDSLHEVPHLTYFTLGAIAVVLLAGVLASLIRERHLTVGKHAKIRRRVKPWQEWPLLLNLATAAAFLAYGKAWLADLGNPIWFAFMLGWLFSVIALSAFAVVRHAEGLAVRLGEPLGTVVLTLSVTGIEVMMLSAIMLAGNGNATLARDAMFAVVMIMLNGMVGLSLLLGGMRYREQTYNLQGASAFLAVIVPLAVLGLVLPNFTASTPGPTLSPVQSGFLIVMSIALYGVFLAIQNLSHREYFVEPEESSQDNDAPAHGLETRSTPYHIALLLAYLLPVVFLSKQLAVPIDYGIRAFHAPAALGGLLVAALILSPESLSGARAALTNQLQRAVNILLGSALATIGLTIPSILTIGFLTGQTIVLGLSNVNTILLVLTLAVSSLTFAGTRTNVLLGAVHLLLFLAYLMLLFER
ncbi:TerC/Alx family metal homeostasis membrane protein [Methylomagnum sp.]